MTDFSVTPFERAFAATGFGGAGIGNLYQAVDDATSTATLQTAWEGGIRYFDTAPHYGLGLAEERLGAFLREQPRDDFVISTKVGRLLRPRIPPLPKDDDMFEVPGLLTRVRDDTAAGIRTSLSESLERTGLDRIDIVWLHDPDHTMEAAMATAVPELRRLKDEGIIGAWGVGMNTASLLRRFVLEAQPDLIMLAGRHTLIEQTDSVPLLDDCVERGVGVVAVGVFNSGLLARDQVAEDATYNYVTAPVEVIDRARTMAQICRDYGFTLPEAAIAFPRRHPAVVNVTVGMSSPEQVSQNLELTTRALPDELFVDLAAVAS